MRWATGKDLPSNPVAQAEETAPHATLRTQRQRKPANSGAVDPVTVRDQGLIPCIGGILNVAKRRHKTRRKADRDEPCLWILNKL